MTGAPVLAGSRCRASNAELTLVRLCLALGASDFGGPLSADEEALFAEAVGLPAPEDNLLEAVSRRVSRSEDPLGELFVSARSAEVRRAAGAFYTPEAIVTPMVAWLTKAKPDTWVDAGCGSGRFAAAAARIMPESEIIAVDSDPIATSMTRAHLRLVGAKRVHVVHGDYTRLNGLLPDEGRTAFVGNPPYVRHHDLSAAQKTWAQTAAQRLGLTVSGLAGLHVHFFLATALYMRPDDIGCFVTSAEWLDVGYGGFLRRLLLEKLGLVSLNLVEDSAKPFADAMTTALVTCFGSGAGTLVRLQRIPASLRFGDLGDSGMRVLSSELAHKTRWSPLFHPRRNTSCASKPTTVPLGTLTRVHRGAATGANEFFILNKEEAIRRGLTAFCRPVLSKAEQVFSSPGIIGPESVREFILDLPASLPKSADAVRAYLDEGEGRGIATRYLCAHRRPWWRLGLKPSPPIVATYMARQAPAFALNLAEASLVNVLHGLYPTVPMTAEELAALVGYLNSHREEFRGLGRTYHGGLEKFEPREMESLPVPPLGMLRKLGKENLKDGWCPRLFADLD